MGALKLSKLPDRTPIKMTIGVLPELHARLESYAQLYAESYGATEQIAELIPAMLTVFLDSDREFANIARKPSSNARRERG
jgi:hypothetical protein